MTHAAATRSALAFVLIAGSLSAQYDETAPEPIAPLRGTLFVGGGGTLPDEVYQRFVELAGGEDARLAVLTYSSSAVVPAAFEKATVVRVHGLTTASWLTQRRRSGLPRCFGSSATMVRSWHRRWGARRWRARCGESSGARRSSRLQWWRGHGSDSNHDHRRGRACVDRRGPRSDPWCRHRCGLHARAAQEPAARRRHQPAAVGRSRDRRWHGHGVAAAFLRRARHRQCLRVHRGQRAPRGARRAGEPQVVAAHAAAAAALRRGEQRWPQRWSAHRPSCPARAGWTEPRSGAGSAVPRR